jgi:hypothetical protein
MTRSIVATFDGRVIVPEEPLNLPAGQELRIEIETVDADKPRFAALLQFEADLPGAPADLASQHDHYLYGTPKR